MLGPQERAAVKLVSEKYDTATTINVAGRIKMGQDHYGKLDLANDPRDWLAEAAEEDWDGIAYRAFHELKQSL